MAHRAAGAVYDALACQLGVTLVAVLDTHVHADHVSGAAELVRRTGIRYRRPVADVKGDEVLAVGPVSASIKAPRLRARPREAALTAGHSIFRPE